MTDLVLSKEELALVHSLAGDRASALHRRAFDVATLLPIICFAAFAFTRHDVVALIIAFFGLFGLYLWRISAESRAIPTYQSLAQKVLDHLHRSREGAAGGV